MTQTEALQKVIDHPIASHARLEILIEDGFKISPKPKNHDERKVVLQKIVAELEKRETEQ